MKSGNSTSMLAALLENMEETGAEDHGLNSIINQLHTAPEEYRTSDELEEEYEAALRDFVSDLSKNNSANSLPGTGDLLSLEGEEL